MPQAADSNVAILSPLSRAVYEPLNFVEMDERLQRAMLAWMDFTGGEIGSILADTDMVGPSTFVFNKTKNTLLNTKVLSRTFDRPAVKISIGCGILYTMTDVDKPGAYRLIHLGRDVPKLDFVLLPFSLAECKIYALTVAGW